MLHAPVLTATSLEPLDRFATLYLIGGTVRLCSTSEAPTHWCPRDFPANASAAIVAMERGHRYQCTLSGACSADQVLNQDDGGLLNPAGAGPQVGRAAYAGGVGDLIEFVYEPAGAGGGGGLNAGQVNALIDTAITRSFITDPSADNTAPTDADWPEGTAPQENDVLRITRTVTDQEEFWIRGPSVDDWTQIHVVAPSNQVSTLQRSEFVAITDIAADTPINANAATASKTSAVGLDYTSHNVGTAATFNDIYGDTLWIYVNGLKVQQSDVSRNNVDPAGYVRFDFVIPNGTEIVFESQVLS